jgi:uncharacterized protein YjbJ (UPF0337 family)
MREGMAMNKSIIKGKWTQAKGKVKKRWGKLTKNNKMVITGEKEKVVGGLQTKYGYAKDKVENTYKNLNDHQN